MTVKESTMTNKPDTKHVRDSFESYFQFQDSEVKRNGNGIYLNLGVQNMWRDWQAALASAQPEIDRLKDEVDERRAKNVEIYGRLCKAEQELAEVKAQRDRLLCRLRETDRCLADVASLKGGWAWEDVLHANTTLFDEIEATKEKL